MPIKSDTLATKGRPDSSHFLSGDRRWRPITAIAGYLTTLIVPAAHHTTHESGGSDAIKLDDLAVPDDNTDLNASTTKHGLMPKGTGSTTTFYRSDFTQAAPAGTGAMTLIEEQNPSSTGVVTFSSLGAYTHLKILYSARGTEVATATSINLTFNSDTGSNYDAQRSVFSTTTSLADQVAQASAIIANISAANAPASYATGGEITVHNYRGTTFFKQAFCAQAGALVAQSTTNINTRLFSAWWRSTAAITSITLTLASGNYVAGSKFSLYGMS
jgi:hypothetical protein